MIESPESRLYYGLNLSLHMFPAINLSLKVENLGWLPMINIQGSAKND